MFPLALSPLLNIKSKSSQAVKPSLMDIIKQRRRSSVRALMTKEPIQNESFLGVVLKPVIKDAKEQVAPQQAKQLHKVNRSLESESESDEAVQSNIFLYVFQSYC